MAKLRVGLVGIGGMGGCHFFNYDEVEGAEIVAVCDPYFDKAESASTAILNEQGTKPLTYSDHIKMLDEVKPTAIIVACSWETHIQVAIDSMERGIVVGMEVGGAYSEKECWDLVDTYEKTKTPFMFLENVCFNKEELLATNLIRKGVLGEMVYCYGAYGHDLREEIASGKKKRHYRLRNYVERNCENYPTHELGPICKMLNINRGNRLTRLISNSSKAVGIKEYVNRFEEYKELHDVQFKQGDIFSTSINCENGELIEIKLDTCTPRISGRDEVYVGTKGRYVVNNNMLLLDGKISSKDYKTYIENDKEYYDYLPEIWKNVTEEILKAGHGGMDYFEMLEFIRCIKTGDEMPIDVYDAATWMSISYLSEISIKENRFVYIPDFTRGKYKTRKTKDVVKF